MRVTRSVCSCVNTSPFVGLTWRTNAPRRTRGLNLNTCQERGEVLERFGSKSAGWVARAGAGDGEETQGGAQAQAQGQGQGQEPSSSSSEEMPLWVRKEQAKEQSEKEEEGKTPFGVYLLASSIVAIASIASIFEYTYQNPIFSIIPPSNFLYKPILGIFVFTGLPLSAFLFYKAIKGANELSESMDKMDDMR